MAVARELTSYGKQAAVDIHRGVAQHTNGFYNVLGWMTVNMLLGNFDAKGGMSKVATWDTSGKGNLFDLKGHPGKITPGLIGLYRARSEDLDPRAFLDAAFADCDLLESATLPSFLIESTEPRRVVRKGGRSGSG